ncbi:hypothetical protein BDF22DRAFT_654205 [Syncephalis plumigaleata]|nr:hypothetical protein BDF22DRAFT_654205 [Syncephalis plumigaleata]
MAADPTPTKPIVPDVPTSFPTAPPTPQEVQQALTPQSIVGAIVALVVGFVLCFFGYRFFRPTLFLAGFVIAAFVTYVVCLNVAPLKGDQYDSIKRTVYIVLVIGVGFIVGVLAVCFWRFGLLLVGAMGGLVGGLFILAFMPNGLIKEPVWKAVLIVILVILGAILIFKFERPVVIVATSAGGGFALALGIDFFVQSQFASTIATVLGGASSAVLSFDAKTYIMLALVAIFAILGMIVQFRFFKGVFGNGKPATDTSGRQDNA